MQKKRALVVISFGSTFAKARDEEIGGITAALTRSFPEYTVFQAFTSNIIRKILRARGIIVPSPVEVMEKLLADNYTEVIIQPTHILHGEEFEQKVLSLQKAYQHKFGRLVIGAPLLTSAEDYRLLAAAVNSILPQLVENEGVVFMGHGSPRANNASFGCTYNTLQKYFDALQLPVIIGVVEAEDSPNFHSVLTELRKRNYTRVHLYPFMVVAGDHALHDMCGENKTSWQKQIEACGIKTIPHLEGLGRQNVIQVLFVLHALRALAEKV